MRGDVSTSLTAPSSRLKEGITSDRWFPLQSERTHTCRIRRVRGSAATGETGRTANCGLTNEDSFRLVTFSSKSNTGRPNPHCSTSFKSKQSHSPTLTFVTFVKSVHYGTLLLSRYFTSTVMIFVTFVRHYISYHARAFLNFP